MIKFDCFFIGENANDFSAGEEQQKGWQLWNEGRRLGGLQENQQGKKSFRN